MAGNNVLLEMGGGGYQCRCVIGSEILALILLCVCL